MRYFFTFLYFLPVFALAQSIPPNPPSSGIVTTSSYSGFVNSLVGFVNMLFGVLIALSVAYIFYGLGLSVINGAGSETERSNAKRVILTGLGGVFVMLSVLGILNIIVGSIEFTG